ncbi:hypothetical protein BOTBODRAFT_109416 [Botryobasidium botryosum FD-172 SS1]|uniref:PHD-type domain-containing protein n=1 Tax=Botryobasidium botryosum (strain FD-172 SS1) TaxID=930990 RepID=A0A067MGG7_BOTB1|nr:hypothetical protein BOTBODRAFT_109416 [Botryobasidium botryosum FD-172 SS1]
MLSCVSCGRSGHPTCLSIEKLVDVVRSYPWKCIECKACEICLQKGDDVSIMRPPRTARSICSCLNP